MSATGQAIARLLRPAGVAVVGASADPSKTAGRPVGYLQRHGFAGAIYPVNPRAASIAGLPCYPDVAALPEAPDVGLVLVGPERATEAVAALARRGTAVAIVLAGGFGETGADGAERQRQLQAAAGEMRLLGPNTIGIVNLVDRIMLSATGALEISDLPDGRISVVSQSGGIVGALLSRAADRGVGFARLVSTGNEADLETADFVEHLAEDPATGVIALYLEGLRRPDRFRAAVLKARAAGKPVVVYKVGRSEPGARSAISHTGAMAGADRVYDAFFRQLGVVRAATFSDLIDVPAALACGRRPKGSRVAILTSTGGAGTLVADGCGLAGLSVPDPDAATARRLGSLLDSEQAAATRNPVDVTLAGVQPDVLRAAIDALTASPGYDAAVVVVGSSALARPTVAADAIVACQGRTEKPVLAFVSPHAPHIVSLLNRQGVPAFASPEACAAALAAMLPTTPELMPAPPPAPASILQAAVPAGLPAGPLDEAEAKRLFAAFGVPCVAEQVVRTPQEAQDAAPRLGARVVVKVLSRHIAHKSDIGGVRVGVPAHQAGEAARAMLADVAHAGAAAPDGIIVQAMVTGGLEVILGFTRDPQLGPAIMLGMGGVAAELIGDSAIRLLPIGRADAQAMLGELRTGRLLTGYRSAPARDVPALIDAILAFARMVEALGDRLAEAEINPLMVLPAGQGVWAVDGLAVLRG